MVGFCEISKSSLIPPIPGCNTGSSKYKPLFTYDLDLGNLEGTCEGSIVSDSNPVKGVFASGICGT